MIEYDILTNKESDKFVVLLHGWGQNKNSMQSLGELLKETYNVIIFDLPGFGESPLDKPYTIEDYVSSLNEMLKLHLIRPTLLIGHSFGGKVAAYYAKKYPVPLLLLAPSIVSPKFSLKIFLKIRAYKFCKLLKRMRLIKKIPNSFKGSRDYQNTDGVLRTTFNNVVHKFLNKDLKILEKEIVVVLGNQDDVIDKFQGKKIQKYIKNGKVIFIDGDHFAYLINKRYITKLAKEMIEENN